jgi:Fungal N-terminal domain of STAND proteins
MEAVGAAASVVTLIELAAKIGSACVHYSRAVKDAAKDISRLQKEVTSLQHLLEQVKQLLDVPDTTGLATSREMKDGIEACETELQALNRKLTPKKTRKAASWFSSRALRWPFETADVDKILYQIDRCKQSITLALQVDQRFVFSYPLSTRLRTLITGYTVILLLHCIKKSILRNCLTPKEQRSIRTWTS